MAWAQIAAAVAPTVLGALAGGSGSPTKQTTNTTKSLQSIDTLNQGRSQLEATADASQLSTFNDLSTLLQSGPGQADITAGMAAQNNLANLYTQMAANGGPSAQNISQAQNYAQQIFQPQMVQMQQQFQQQGVDASRLAARLGRPVNDPILRNKLAQTQSNMSAQLNAQQGAFAAQQAQANMNQGLQLNEALAQLRGGLASQALANRQSLLQIGQNLAQQERNYRTSMANTSSTTRSTSGGGMAGGISGALAGLGGGLSLIPKLKEAFGGSGNSGTQDQTVAGGSYSNTGAIS